VPRLEQLIRTWRFGSPIVIVSGLPRSGTSMLMKMLDAGGVPILTDSLRPADEDNPNGYFEYEPVKQLDKAGDHAWLRGARGRAVKVISLLLTWLPETYNYQVLFMERDLDEVMASQDAMLERRGESASAGKHDATRAIYAQHLQQVDRFMANRRCFTRLSVGYRDVVADPEREARRIQAFLGRPLDVAGMAAVTDPRLYRNRPRPANPA
jgi:hypothetical protein